ncbi:MAG: restriction endonuclease subunit S, partial [Prevotella sp.]|nr:restriction endonuclease subunit S [Prevotella sp.]
IDTYVTTDNMLQNKLGIIAFEGVANISSITEYKKNDILISNIRPYLKKIWLADKDGGCSKDVLVLRSSAPDKFNPKYIYYMLQRDAFFDFVMKSVKGIKMPRGNKTEILKYEIPISTIQQQRNILSQIEKLENEISNANTVISQAPQLKQAVLDKYL